MTRAPGFYWVKRRSGKWTVAEYALDDDGGYWMIPGSDMGWDDDDFREIDERRIERPA